MFKLEPTAMEMKAASLVAESSQLTEVRLSRVRIDNKFHMTSDIEALFPEVGFGLICFEISEKGVLVIEVGVRLFIGTQSEKDSVLKDMKDCPENGVLIEIDIIGEYKLPEGPIPEEISKDGIPAFAKFNGLYNCWPYFRQHLQYVTSSMGLPAFNLGPLIVRVQKPESTTTR